MNSSEKSPAVRALVIVVLTLATAAMITVSLRGNYLFGYGFGQSADRAQIFGWANVAADLWKAAGLIVVAYEATETSWRLAVSDNGIGAPEGYLKLDKSTSGLGTIIIEALAKQLDARVEVVRNPKGTTVSITHGTSDPAWPSLTGSASLTGSGGRWLVKSNGGSVAAV